MTTSYVLGSNPEWYFPDATGRPLGSGTMISYSSLNKTIKKSIFQDPSGSFPYPNPLSFDMNGTRGPFYFEFDSNNPDNLYYLEIYDVDGNLRYQFDNFIPSGGSGGSVITTALDLENFIINNNFYRNISASANPTTTNIVLCPSNHEGYSSDYHDIRLVKNTFTATDQITFPTFSLGETPLTGDVTPLNFLKYACSNSPVGETEKSISFPIAPKVKNLENQNISFSIWARGVSGTQELTPKIVQFFGDGGSPSATVKTIIDTINLSTDWTKYTFQATVPSVTGKVLGTCGNDALLLYVQYPLGVPCEIDFVKPCWYLGDIAPSEDFHTIDMASSITNTARTGDIRVSINNFASSGSFGWLLMNDGTIGSASSGGTQRANIDTFPLFELLWTNVSDTYAPVSGGRGVSAVADFNANKTIALTKQLGRAISGIGIPSSGGTATNWALGQTFGTEQHTLTTAEMPSHNHTGSADGIGTTQNPGGTVIATQSGPATVSVTIGHTGGGAAHNIIQPTIHYNILIKL